MQGYECTANNDNLWHTNGELIRNKDGRALWWRGDNGMFAVNIKNTVS